MAQMTDCRPGMEFLRDVNLSICIVCIMVTIMCHHYVVYFENDLYQCKERVSKHHCCEMCRHTWEETNHYKREIMGITA